MPAGIASRSPSGVSGVRVEATSRFEGELDPVGRTTRPLRLGRGGGCFEPLGEAVHPPGSSGGGFAGEVGGPVGRAGQVDAAQPGDLPEGSQLVGVLGQGGGYAAALGPADRPFERPVRPQQVPRRFLADAPGAGEPVRRVAPKRDEVGHLLGFDAVAPSHTVGIHDLGAGLARPGGKEHRHPLAHALEHVPVAGEEQGPAPGLRLEGRQRAEQVVGLEGVVADHLPAEGAEEPGRVGPLGLELDGHRGPVGVVGGIELHSIVSGLGAGRPPRPAGRGPRPRPG